MNNFINVVKMGETVIHGWDHNTVALTLALNTQDGSVCIRDILASCLDSGREWRRILYLYLQSMVLTNCC